MSKYKPHLHREQIQLGKYRCLLPQIRQYENMTEDEQNKVYNTIGLAPNISIPVKGDGSSTTKSVIAAGTIDIRENKAQDISVLSRDTANSLNELGKIFGETWLESQATG